MAASNLKKLNLFRLMLMYIGFVLSAELWLSWYVILRDNDPLRPSNMGPMVVLFAPFLSAPLLAVSLFVDRLAFPKARGFRWSVTWFLLGIAYGSIWSAYPFAVTLPRPVWALATPFMVTGFLVSIVRRSEPLIARRAEG